MSKKIIGVEADSLPPMVKGMLQHFQANFGGLDYTVTHYRNDAVFVQVYGMCNVYSIARFIHNTPDVYIELEATSHYYWTLRMFCNDRLREHELPNRLAWSQMAPDCSRPITHVKVRADANQ